MEQDAGIGAAVGLTLAIGATQLLRSLLVGVEPLDAATFGSVSLVVLAVTLLASWLPARRAAGLDPLEALRHE